MASMATPTVQYSASSKTNGSTFNGAMGYSNPLAVKNTVYDTYRLNRVDSLMCYKQLQRNSHSKLPRFIELVVS